jgi:hypothetical protein
VSTDAERKASPGHSLPDLQHFPFFVQEHHIDWEIHPEGVNCFAGRNPEPLPMSKTFVFEQTGTAF